MDNVGKEQSRMDLLALQGRMKQDPGGYEEELLLQFRHFHACIAVFSVQSPFQTTAGTSAISSYDPTAAKELADMAMFLAHVTPSYPQHLSQFPKQLLGLLKSQGHSLPAFLRRHLTQALILLRNRQMIELIEILPVLMELQLTGDRVVRKLAFSHVVHDICRLNRKHRNEATNRGLQNALFPILQDENENKAKHVLALICELHRRKVWMDERVANAICAACFHKSSRIMIAALRFLHGYDEKDNDEEDSDESSEEEEESKHSASAAVSREAVYKAFHKGTASSRKKKQAKLERARRSLKKQQRLQSHGVDRGSFAPLQHLHDPQGFAEKLFARLNTCNERFEVKLMLMMVISRAVGMHRLILLNFYPYVQRYIQPHQRDVTQLLATAVQACHDMVPPDAVEPMLRQLVNQFVHDRARPEVIAVGLNVVREICLRIPLIMTRELLQDLAMYKKSHEKAVASAARSIIAVYRQLCPSLLEKRDRGRNANILAQPKAFGQIVVASEVPGAELLLQQNENDIDILDDDVSNCGSDSEANSESSENASDKVDELDNLDDVSTKSASEVQQEQSEDDEDIVESDSGQDWTDSEEDEKEEECIKEQTGLTEAMLNCAEPLNSDYSCGKKRKVEEAFEVKHEEPSTNQSLRQLKKLATNISSRFSDGLNGKAKDGILSNEDFEHIRQLQAKQAAEAALAKQGIGKVNQKRKEPEMKLPTSDTLGNRRVNPTYLEAKIHKRREKEERLASARAGREDRLAYGARTAIKKKKTGGLSNRQKEKRKGLPLAAKRAKIAARSREQKRSKSRSNKQFRGKKAWKQ